MTLYLCRDLDSEFIKTLQIVFFEDVLQLAIKHSDVWTVGGEWSVREESPFCQLVLILCAKFNENLQKGKIVKQMKMTATLDQGFLGNSIDR